MSSPVGPLPSVSLSGGQQGTEAARVSQKSTALGRDVTTGSSSKANPAEPSVSRNSLGQVGNPSQAKPIQAEHASKKGPAARAAHLVSVLKGLFAKIFGSGTKKTQQPARSASVARPESFRMDDDPTRSFLDGLQNGGFERHFEGDPDSLKGSLENIVTYEKDDKQIRGEAKWLLGKIAEKGGDVAGAKQLYRAAVADGYVPKDNAAQLAKANAVIDHGMAVLLQRAQNKDKSVDGIFRVTASASEVNAFHDSMNEMAMVDDKEHASIQEHLGKSDSSFVGEAILRMVRPSSATLRGGLSTSLIPSSQYRNVLGVMRGSQDEAERVAGFKEVIAQFPPENKETLQKLAGFLGALAKHEGVTQMGTSNLAMVFASNILVPPGDVKPMEEMANTGTAVNAIQFMIEHQQKIFE